MEFNTKINDISVAVDILSFESFFIISLDLLFFSRPLLLDFLSISFSILLTFSFILFRTLSFAYFPWIHS